MSTDTLNATEDSKFRIVLLFWGETDYLDTDTGAIESSQKAYRMSPKWGKTLKDIFPYFTAAIKGDTWTNRIPRKLLIYEGETEVFRLPQGTGAITNRQGNTQQRLKSLKEWRGCIELYERTNGRQLRKQSDVGVKNTQIVENTYRSVSVPNPEPIKTPSNPSPMTQEERTLKNKMWYRIKSQVEVEKLRFDVNEWKHIKRELTLRNIQHIESYFEDGMEYLRKAHEQFKIALQQVEEAKEVRVVEVTTISKDTYGEFRSLVGFRPLTKVTTNSTIMDKKKAQAVQELYDLYQEKHKKTPSNGRVNVWQNVMSKSNSETEINNHLSEIKQNL